MTDKKLDGKIALITGASRGIGAATAKLLAAQGAHVILVARTVGGLEEIDDAIQGSGGHATLVPLDLKDGEGIDRLGGAIAQRWGHLDILVGNAGLLGQNGPLSHIPPKTWEETFAVNVHANWRLIRSMDSLLRAAPAARAAFITSGAAGKGEAYWGLYAATKAALDALVRAYAAEIGFTNVRANLYSPGPTRTAMRNKAFPGEDKDRLRSPENAAEHLLPLLLPEFTENGVTVRARD